MVCRREMARQELEKEKEKGKGGQTDVWGQRACSQEGRGGWERPGLKQCWWRGRLAWTGVLQGGEDEEEEGCPQGQG